MGNDSSGETEEKRAKPRKLPNRELVKERRPRSGLVKMSNGTQMFAEGITQGWAVYSEDKEGNHPVSGLPYAEPHDPAWAVIEYKGPFTGNFDPKTGYESATGITMDQVLPNRNKRPSAHKAWAAVRHSRAPEDTVDILNKMGRGGVDPGESLAGVVVGLTHTGGGSLAHEEVHANGCPLHLPFILYHRGVVMEGQEKSTRFQAKFADKPLMPMKHFIPRPFHDHIGRLEGEYQDIGRKSNEIIEKHKEPITKAYTEFFRPEKGKGGRQSAEEKSLDSRVLDTVRFAILMGQRTGFALDVSSNEWSSIIASMGASDNPYYRNVGKQIKTLLSPRPEVEELMKFKAPLAATIRHAEPEGIAAANLESLRYFFKGQTDLLEKVEVNRRFRGFQEDGITMIPKEFSSSVRMAGQYITTLWPGMSHLDAMKWVKETDDKTKRQISKRIFEGHSHHKQVPQLGRTSDLGFVVDVNLGEARDLNRNRAWGRDMAFPLLHSGPLTWDMMNQVMARGFGLPAYLTEIEELKPQKEAFQEDIEKLYETIGIFSEKFRDRFGDSVAPHALTNVIPLAHRVPIVMHGDPKQAKFISSLRTPPGGHINYRIPMFDLPEKLADEDPLLEGLRLPISRPDAANKDEFFSRK